MKTINTTVSTGDEFTSNGITYKVGIYKKGVINLHVKLSETSGYTIQVSTRELNKLLKSN